MFNNLIYFLLILLIFTAYQPGDEAPVHFSIGIPLILAGYVLYWRGARLLFTRLRRLIAAGAVSSSSFYHRLTVRLSIIAVILFAVDVFVLGLKDVLATAPLLSASTALEGLTGVAFFAGYLALLWAESYDVYKQIYNTRLKRVRFVFSQVRFNLPIILPYLILSAIVDVISWSPLEGLKKWIGSPAGELIFVLVFICILMVYLPPIVKPLWGLKSLPEGPHRDAIIGFCRRNGFKFRDIMLWPLYEGEGLTAGVMGLSPRWRYILVTKSLLRILDENELDAVLAHEFGHVKKHHLALYLVIFLGFMVTAYMLENFLPVLFFLPEWFLTLLVDPEAAPYIYMGFMAALMILYFRFIFGFYMRNFERQADLFAYRLTGSVEGLVGSLEKIAYYSGQSRSVPSWHHFSVAQRVEFLEECRNNPIAGRKHDRKIKKMLIGFFLVIALIGATGFSFERSGFGEDVNRKLAVKLLTALALKNPHSFELHFELGNVFFESGRTGDAIAAYERAAILAPKNPEVLNNLAWSLVVKEDASDDEKERGLEIARAAASLKASPHILDTLAEAYYVNGKPDVAVRIIDQAVDLAEPETDLEYYKSQKDKFLKSAAGNF